jgi:hypothetical protein
MAIAAAGLLGLTACGQKAACYGLSDADVVAKVMHDFDALPAIDKADPSQTQFSKARVLGIGRNAEAKDSGKALTQIWFAQDDHTVTVATYLESCALSIRPNLAPDAIKQAAIPVRPPRF